MKHSALILLLAASTVAASAHPPPNRSAPAAKPATTAAKPAATAAAKLPFGVPAPGIPAVKTSKKTLFSLRYQEIEIGKGAVAEPNKMYKVHYTGWLGANGRADDGRKFDSSYDHPGPPVKDKDGKPGKGDHGQPQRAAP